VLLLLKDIWPIGNFNDYKVHFARWNGETQPLEAFVRNKNEWQGWQEYRPSLCTRMVTDLDSGSLHQILGSPDDMKFQSSMTLFAVAAADPASPFYKALDRWCGGTLDAQTLRLLEVGGPEHW
jgi:uncharacterized protein DUF1810